MTWYLVLVLSVAAVLAAYALTWLPQALRQLKKELRE